MNLIGLRVNYTRSFRVNADDVLLLLLEHFEQVQKINRIINYETSEEPVKLFTLDENHATIS